MPRIPRKYLPDKGFFHVICRSNNKLVIFKEDEDFEEFIGRVVRYKIDWPFDIYNYCLMPTHVHFVINTRDIFYLSKAFQGIQVSYASYYSKKYSYKGHLWHAPFRSIPIKSEHYLTYCGRYVEINAVNAGIVQHPDAYSWSSYKYNVHGVRDKLVESNPSLACFGDNIYERRQGYKSFIYAALSLDADEEMMKYENVKVVGDIEGE